LGLGGLLYPLNDLPAGNMGPGSNGKGDFLGINGAFKTPTFRNVDKRPHPGFVKAYMHNGALKSLKQVVHFYNTRNLTTRPGEVIDFTQEHPYANLQGIPLWPPPEISSPESLENPTGAFNSDLATVGNLGLTNNEEDHIVAFLKTLTDSQ
jgi:cytochrome c peroxidase